MNGNPNQAFVNLVHAMLGAITPNWRAVFLNASGDCLSVTFVLASESETDREEIEEVAFEFEALQPDCDVSVEVSVSAAPIELFRDAGRLVFARKE